MEETVMIFRIQEEEYALPVDETKGTFEHWQMTKVPTTLKYLEGVINVQSQIVPVIRLSEKFGLLGDRPQPREVLIVGIKSQLVGLIVDEVVGITSLEVGRIEPASQGCNYLGSCIAGFGRLEERLIILLDIDRIFTDAELDTYKEVGKIANN